MDIEAWFESMPAEIVNDIAREKRFIGYAIHDKNALNFKNQDYIIKDILTMARKVKNAHNEQPTISGDDGKSKANGNGSQRKTRWASADIRSHEHKDAIRELSKNPDFILDTIIELIDDGYDLYIKRADAGSTVRSMLFCNIPNHANDNGGLSAEAPDAWLSITAIVYKHVIILDGRWFDDSDTAEETDVWR